MKLYLFEWAVVAYGVGPAARAVPLSEVVMYQSEQDPISKATGLA